MSQAAFPLLNACLNALSGTLMIVGVVLAGKKALKAHGAVMAAALFVSVLFLISYLTYHYLHGSMPFEKQGWIRPVYFTILISHTILAALVPPLAIATVVQAVKHRYERHVKLAHILVPIWLYVSVTGVVIYLMLYQL